MSQILRLVLLAVYIGLLIHILKLLRKEQKTIIEIEYLIRPRNSLKKITWEVKRANKNAQGKYQYVAIDPSFQPPIRLPTDFKYVLKWTKAMTHYSDPDFVNGQRPFLDNNCMFNNCFMTNDKYLLTDLRYYDAILFDVENDWDYHPHVRALHQKYIFTASEPAGLFPICDPSYDSYYNWSWSYRLDSTIPQPFFNIYFKGRDIAGPMADMQWLENDYIIPDSIKSKLKHKKKLAAWFVSHCKTKSKREKLVADINKHLEMYNYTIDIYGWCGKHMCPKDDLNTCLEMLQTDYYFYMAFENSLDEDYVSEKVLHALNHYTVPIVFGGANYSRFLPPDSYINARSMSPRTLASLMVEISRNQATYYTYFTWYRNYEYKENSLGSSLCELCEALNGDIPQTSVLNNFTKWWNAEGACDKHQKVQHSPAMKQGLNNQIS